MRWYCEAIDCDVCAGIFDPPCPFHREETPVTVLASGFWRWFQSMRRAQAIRTQG